MRRLIALMFVALIGLCNGGCLINQYSSEPNVRAEQLINQSEDLRALGQEWRRIWFNDMPSHLTPDRVHGGMQ